MLRRMTPEEREAFHAEFLRRASVAFGRMFNPEEQHALITWDQRERRATEITGDLLHYVMEQHVQGDDQVEPAADAVLCPQCRQAAEAVAPEDEPPRREVHASAGKVGFSRREHFCRTCRRRFFPPRHRASARDRRLQPEPPQEDRVRRR